MAADVKNAASAWKRFASRVLLSVATAAVVGGLVAGVTKLAGTSWAAVAGTLRQVSFLDLVVLLLVWIIGLWCHSWVLTAALPGLTRGRALLLNVSGSAISDLLPFGAAAGTGVNLAMIRSWNFSATRFASFTTISNLWNVMAKLALPAGVLTAALLSGAIQSARLVVVAQTALALATTLGVVAVAVIADGRAASGVGRAVDRIAGVALKSVGSKRVTSLAQSLPAVRQETAAVIRQGWLQLSVGVVSYLLLQGVLWFLCLQAVGTVPATTVVAVGFTVERVLSMLPFTPGGAGLAEAGSIAVLVSLGGDPVTMTAGVLLYRGFAFLLEIPVGGAGLLAWFWHQRRTVRRALVIAP